MTVKVARSKLRDVANRNNSNFLEALIEEGTLTQEYNTPVPSRVGRVVDGESTTFRASLTSQAIHVPRNLIKQFVPDPIVNPLNNANPITAKTKLSPTITLSRFLGSEDPINIKYIRNEETKRQIAKHLYLQTLIINKIQNNQSEFEGVTINVTEGLYQPGQSETITPDSINDLKSKGRAVVYNAIDNQGNSNNSRLFDIAAHIKDNSIFDQLILSYDTMEHVNNSPIVTARMIVTMPEINDSFQGTFKRDVYTEFNNNKLSQGELVECLQRTS